MNTKQERQHTPALYIDRLEESGTARLLDRAEKRLSDGKHNEEWLQNLIFRFPQLLPVHEIEPGFDTLLPVCLELPTPAGFADNLYITSGGDLVVAECKLWRNPEARREVVAQIIDYAHGMARWTYSDLQDAAAKGRVPGGKASPKSLYGLVEGTGELDEPDFIDAVSRNLRLGRLLLLVIGDGIREGVESLSGFLQTHAGFHFTLGMIEMPVFKLPAGGYLVQPRILARTVNIERGIVRISDGQVVVDAPSGASGRQMGRTASISKDRLLEMLATVDPNLPETLQFFMDRASDLGVVLESAPKSLQIRWHGPQDRPFALGGIDEWGQLITYNVTWAPDNIGHIEIAHAYLEDIASIIDCEVRQTSKRTQWYVAIKGTKQWPAVTALLAHQDKWLAAIEKYTDNIMRAVADSPRE